MARSIPDNNPFKMHTVRRRDLLDGEAGLWYDRAAWLRGRTLNIPASERTAFQHQLDTLWQAVDQFSGPDSPPPDVDRLERIYRSFFERWPEALAGGPPDSGS
jgi:hypothetical protein